MSVLISRDVTECRPAGRGINSLAAGVAGRTACERREGRQAEKRRARE
jgi:hypothetical protein